MNRISMFGLLTFVGLLFAAGCDKKLTLQMTNTLPQPVDRVMVQVPGEGMVFFGTLQPGEPVKRKVKIPKDMLPAQCSVQAGGITGEFTIQEKTKDPLSIYIDHTGITFVPKGYTVQQHQQFEGQRTAEQKTVVVPPPEAPAQQDGQPAKPSGGTRVIEQDTVVE